jgi:hypothetical protein
MLNLELPFAFPKQIPAFAKRIPAFTNPIHFRLFGIVYSQPHIKNIISMKKIILLSVWVLCIVCMAYGQWTYSDLSEAKAYMGATALGSKAYFAGGMNSSGLKSTVEIYDAMTGEWDTTQHLSVARDLPSATTCGNLVIFAGGVDFFSTGIAFSTVDIFDTQSQSWSVYNLSVPRFNVAAFSHDSQVYFVGGVDNQLGIAYDVVDIFDVVTQEWTVTSLDDVRVVYGGVVNDLAILPGGFVASGVTKRVDIINLTTGTWSIDSLSVARAWVGVTSVGNKMLIAGGAISGDIQSDTVDIYDASTGTWSSANLSLARSFADGQNAVTACGKAYFLGGGILNLNGPYWDAAYNVIDIYDPVTDSWSVDYLFNSYVHRAAVSVGDKILVAGGITMTGLYRSDVEIYTCPPSFCLPEGIAFTTQEQIDYFQANYPGCTHIGGEVKINGVSNLNGLNVLTSIGETLKIGNSGQPNPYLTSLAGLENLSFVGGDLLIGGATLAGPSNPNLTSLEGLDNLTSIGGKLKIIKNPALTSLNAMEGLTFLGGDIFISNNQSLTNCAAQGICNNVTSPNGVVDIFNNGPGCNSQSEVASNCGGSISCLPYGNYYFLTQTDIDNFQINFPACNELEGNLTINGNSITNLTGLNQVLSIGGSLDIKNCGSLTNLTGLNNLSNIGGDIYIFHNESLINFTGLENLGIVGGSFGMYENNQLLSLSGLEYLDTIGGWLNIGTVYTIGVPNPPPGGNELLINLSSLASLTYVGGGIDIGKNNSLLSLSGLENIDANTVTDLLIGNNNSLSTCDVKSVCDYLSSPNGTVEIEYNAPGCDSPEEVEAACAITTVEEIKTENGITIIPNPSNDKITISSSAIIGVTQLSIFNVSGEKVIERQLTETETQINISALPRGVYFVRLQNEKMVEVGKMVKE